ncbi:MAG: DUF302 domain-containing protein [Gammaproteobacteria bacterium]
MIKKLLLALLLGYASLLQAESGLWTTTIKQPMEQVYPVVYKALEDNRFFVVLEPDMGSRMANFAERWGEDYNRNQLDGIRSMVFCNIWWTNRMANTHPHMLGLCPLSISLYEKGGETTLVLPRPSALAAGSAGGDEAMSAAKELEQELTDILSKAAEAAGQ